MGQTAGFLAMGQTGGLEVSPLQTSSTERVPADNVGHWHTSVWGIQDCNLEPGSRGALPPNHGVWVVIPASALCGLPTLTVYDHSVVARAITAMWHVAINVPVTADASPGH